MITLESLNRDYQRIANWQDLYRQSLLDYLKQGLQFCGGKATLEVECRSYQQAEDAGVDFDDQFPIAVSIEDRHSFHHEIYVTSFYWSNNLFYVSGFDRTDGKWIEDWYTDDSETTYASLAYLLDAVLNQEENDEETTANQEAVYSKEPVLIGYQLVDEDNAFPCQMTCWDVFRNKEDAEEYKAEMLEPCEWRIVEEWSTPHTDLSNYKFHGKQERVFTKGEKVWIAEEYVNRYTKIFKDQSTESPEEMVIVVELDDLEGVTQNGVKAENIYQLAAEVICPKCGQPLYVEHHPEIDYPYFCPECDENFYSAECRWK